MNKKVLTVPVLNGDRIIIIHARCDTGFNPNSLVLWKSSSSLSYHSLMNYSRFSNWDTEKPIPDLPEYSILLINNTPDFSSYKNSMIDCLKKNKISLGQIY